MPRNLPRSYQRLEAANEIGPRRYLRDRSTSSATRFEPALGELREHCFEGMAQFGDMSGEERREWFIKYGNFFIE
jgi:hypothetical protein